MMMLMMVMIIFSFIICDEREDCFHQVKVVDPGHHYHHLVDVLWRFFLVTVI